MYLRLSSGLHRLEHEVPNLSRALSNVRASLLQCPNLVAGGTLSSADDGSGVTHSSAWRSSSASNESNDWLVVRVVGLDVFGGILFHGTTDFTDQNDTFSLGVRKEDLDDIEMLSTRERVSSDSNGQGLTKTGESRLATVSVLSQLKDSLDRFVCEPKGQLSLVATHVPDRDTIPMVSALDDSPTNLSLLEDVSRHDAHFACVRYDTGAVSSNHPRLALRLQCVVNTNLIPLRDAFGDGDDQLDLVFNCLDNGIRGAGGRDVDD